MTRSTGLRWAACLTATLFWATPAQTSIPGSDISVLGGLQHVCQDNVPADGQEILCVEREGPFLNSPYTASECGSSASFCVPDTIPGAHLWMSLQMLRDENTIESNVVGAPFPDPPIDNGDTAGLIVRFRAGHRWHRFVDLFSGTRIGNWNSFAEEQMFGRVGLPNAQSPQYFSHNLVDLGERITEVADPVMAQDLSGAVPYMIHTRYLPWWLRSDESGQDEPLGSMSSHLLKVGWVRVLP